jgi:DNA-binding transcriptional MerR regulator
MTTTMTSRPTTSRGGTRPSKGPSARRDTTRGSSARRSKPSANTAADAAAVPEHGKLYYRIGEVSRLTGVKPYVLRYWESEFRWMAPQKSRSQQRLYRRRDIDTILLIKRLLYEERFTIAGARRKLRELGVGKALEAPQLDLGLEVDQRGRVRRIRAELAAIRAMV